MSHAYLLVTAGLLVGVNASLYAVIFAPPIIRATPLALGQGSATLLTLPSGQALLINAGPDASVVRAVGGVLPPWQRRIGALVLLSESPQEAGGAPYLLERYQVGRVEKIPPGAGAVLRYGALALPLSADMPRGTYAVH